MFSPGGNAEWHPDVNRVALSIQQPWAELILQGQKSVEVRRSTTRVRGTVYLYAGKQFSTLPGAIESVDKFHLGRDDLSFGGLVGVVDVIDSRPSVPEDAEKACVPVDLLKGTWSWILENPVRFSEVRPVAYPPFGPWFYPFQRKGSSRSRQEGERGSRSMWRRD